jgi:hypothetical protein
LDELEEVTRRKLAGLRSQRDHLVQLGHPRTVFETYAETWHQFKQCNNATVVEKWAESQELGEEFRFPPVNFDEDTLVDSGLSATDVRRVVGNRGRMLDLKIALLQEVLAAFAARDADDLWRRCLKVLVDRLSDDDVRFNLYVDLPRYLLPVFQPESKEFHLVRMGYWEPLDGQSERSDQREPACRDPFEAAPFRYRYGGESPLIGAEAGLLSGGFSNVLVGIGHYEEELRHGILASAREFLGDLVTKNSDGIPGLAEKEYLSFLGKESRRTVDAALDFLRARRTERGKFWEGYFERVKDALGLDFYVDVGPGVRITRRVMESGVPQVDDFCASFGANVFRKKGAYWEIVYERKGINVKDRRGIQYLEYLA